MLLMTDRVEMFSRLEEKDTVFCEIAAEFTEKN